MFSTGFKQGEFAGCNLYQHNAILMKMFLLFQDIMLYKHKSIDVLFDFPQPLFYFCAPNNYIHCQFFQNELHLEKTT